MDFSKIKENLTKRGFKVTTFNTKEEANDYLCSEIRDTTVGICGTMTVVEMGLYDKLAALNDVHWHWIVPKGETTDDVRGRIRDSEVFLMSVNGIAETGEIINIDGRCDRVSNMFDGHKKIYFIVGSNKIAPDYDSALWRARNIASPLNAKRLGRKTPCAIKGDKCYDCNSPERICRGLTVLWRAPNVGDYEVILIDEKLGY